MGARRPKAVLIENVTGFATSKCGEDLRATIATLNGLGYACDLFVLDARWFVPQSRPRLFMAAFPPGLVERSEWCLSALRPAWVLKLAGGHPGLRLQAFPLPDPPQDSQQALDDIVERIALTDGQWWDATRLGQFLSSLSLLNAQRLELMRRSEHVEYATAYRRTRKGKPVWEIRGDKISGCLRTARGGSSKQALVQAGQGTVRVRWMTAREYARLQGAPNLNWGDATEGQAKFGLGDAVCVPAVSWLASNYLAPIVVQAWLAKHNTTTATV
jgi:DNA (cytosine-5)-methyltransferase 1